MVSIHMTIGTLVLLGYLVLTILNVLSIRGRTFNGIRPLSFAVAALLVVQYLIGFDLLADDPDQNALHYVVALATLIPVGFEHAVANSRTNPEERARLAALANAATFVLVLIAYVIGETA
jgi:hypothetical protein